MFSIVPCRDIGVVNGAPVDRELQRKRSIQVPAYITAMDMAMRGYLSVPGPRVKL